MSSRIAYRIVHKQLLSPMQCAQILSWKEDFWTPGTVDNHIANLQIRKASIQPFPLNSVALSFLRDLEKVVYAANQQYWNFQLDGFVLHDDPPQFVRYQKGDHYEWHIDHDHRSATRKLTCILQLSDDKSYLGGDFCVFPPVEGEQKKRRLQGTLIILPVYVPHRVLPIIEGYRDVLVGWMHGRPFS